MSSYYDSPTVDGRAQLESGLRDAVLEGPRDHRAEAVAAWRPDAEMEALLAARESNPAAFHGSATGDHIAAGFYAAAKAEANATTEGAK